MEADDNGLPPLAGRRLADRYLVETLIGRGGMAAVYRGRDELLARPVALKVLVGPLAHDPAASKRFRAEARAAAAVTHPNVVGVYDVGEDGEWAFIVMELVQGESLAKRLTQGPLEPAAAALVGADVLSGLEAAHQSGLLHRDIKPGNVILTPDGTAKLADFGIAKAMKSVATATQPVSDPGIVLGTLSYLAPERLRGEAASVRSDIWSVGAVLYEAVTGRSPFGLGRLSAEDGAQVDLPEVPVRTARPDVGPELASVIERAMAPAPEERFGSAAEMREALVGTEEGIAAPAAAAGLAAAVLPLEETQAFMPVTAAPAAFAGAVAADDATAMLPLAGAAGAAGAGEGGAPLTPPEREGRAWLLLPLALVVLLLVGLGFVWRSSGGGGPAKPPTTVGHRTDASHHSTTTTSSSTSTSTTTSSSTTTSTSSTTTVPPTTTSTTSTTIPVVTSSTVLPTTTSTTTTTTTTTPPTTTTGPPPPAPSTTSPGGGG